MTHTVAQGTIVSYRDDGTGRVRLNTLAKVDPKRGLRMTVAELAGYAGCPPRPISMLVLLRAVGREGEREREREGKRERESEREREREAALVCSKTRSAPRPCMPRYTQTLHPTH